MRVLSSQHRRRNRGRYWKLVQVLLLSLLALTFVWRLLVAVHILETMSPDPSLLLFWNNHNNNDHNNRQQTTHSISVVVTSADSLSAFGTSRHDSFCTSWQVLVDDWWTHRPDYEQAYQMTNTTHQCFRPIANPKKVALFSKLYATQFPATSTANNNSYSKHEKDSSYDSSSCSNSYTKLVSNSGWGLDLSHIVDGLLYAVDHGVPVQLVNRGSWQYAEKVCPAADWSCYFLPLTSCSMDSSSTIINMNTTTSASTNMNTNRKTWRDADAAMQGKWLYEWRGFARLKSVRWLLQYATRSQQWIREKAVTTAAAVKLQTPCTVIHVRRADVVLHGRWSRRYHAVQEYLDALQTTLGGLSILQPTFGRNILLLTDDSNAVTEALQQHGAGYHWMYLNRYRHKGASGGWENQIPSNDPAGEVAALLASAELMKECDCLVHSKSNLADYYYAVMKEANPGVVRIDLDDGKDHDAIHSASNAETVRLSLDASRP
jgi:hypothetical protein